MPFVIITLVALGLALAKARQYRSQNDTSLTVLAALVPLLVAALVVFIWCGVVDSAYYTWNYARLAQTFALKMGYRLYYPAQDGPMLGTIYGPIGILAFWPATIARTPTIAVLIGATLNALLFLCPLPWLFSRIANPTQHQKPILISILVACAGSIMASSFSFFAIHCDAPSLALALLACIPLIRRRGENEKRDFFLSAFFLSLAFWCKQTVGVLIVVLPIYIWLNQGFTVFKRYLSWVMAVFAIVSALVLFSFGATDLYFNVFVVPYKHMGAPGALSFNAFLRAFSESLQYVWPYLLAITALLSLQNLPLFKRWKESPISLLLFVALALIPTSLASRLKPGGLPNSFYMNYFIIVAAYVLWMEFLSGTNSAYIKQRFWARLALPLVSVLCLFNTRSVFVKNIEDADDLSAIRYNVQELAYNFVKAYPQMLYLPWSPLSSLLGEGKLYNFGDAVWGRETAGFAPSSNHFHRYVPQHVRYIAWFDGADRNTNMLKYFPEMTERISLRDLPYFHVFTDKKTAQLMKEAAKPR